MLPIKILIQSSVRIKIIIIKEHSWTQIYDSKVYAKPKTQSSVSINVDIDEGIIQDENVQDEKKYCFEKKCKLPMIVPHSALSQKILFPADSARKYSNSNKT